MDALVVASTDKQRHAISDVLYRARIDSVLCSTAAEARRTSFCRPFDIFIVNSELPDEHGNTLAVDIAEANDVGGIFIDDFTRAEKFTDVLGNLGILTLSRPITKTLLYDSVRLILAANARVRALKAKNDELSAKLEDLKYISRAKIVLMRTLGYTEDQAHKHIEKLSMDRRVSRRKIAVDILKTYEEA